MAIFKFAADKLSSLAARCLYATVEGWAFLFSRNGALIVGASSWLALAHLQGPGRTLAVAAKAAALCAGGRAVWALAHTLRRPQRGGGGGKGEGGLAESEEEAIQSVWDWRPPQDDAYASGAWSILKQLALTAEKMRASYPDVARLLALPALAPPELACRLYYLYALHERQQVASCGEAGEGRQGEEAPPSTVALLKEYRPLACLAYDKVDDVALAEALGKQEFRLIAARYDPEVVDSGCPAFYIALSAARAEVLLCVRGTYSAQDVFTDLLAAEVDFGPGGSAHSGMAKAALFLDGKFGDLLAALHGAGNQVSLIGHSLGAGVAALLAVLLQRRGLEGRLRCVAFEPPACMDRGMAEGCSEYVTSLVTGDDVVPRLAPGPFVALLEELAAFDYKSAAEEQGMPAALGMMQHLTSLFTAAAPAQPEGGKGAEGREGGAGQEGRPASSYDPFVPGTIVCACFREGGSGGSGAEGGGEGQGTDAACVLRLAAPADPLLRHIRLSPRMLTDHYIDKGSIIKVLEDALTLFEPV